jgi:DNA-binding LacI/PurR family transcriptional regulator
MATIKQVAEMAGVSVGTVSHVITGSVPVSGALRANVEAAIRELDYHPNHVARSLKTNKTRTLGIMVPDLTIPFFPQMIRGAETAARKQGYSLVAVNSDDSVDRQRDLLSLLRSQRVEGMLLVVASGMTPADQIGRMVDAGIPVVCLDRIPDKVAVDSVSVEDASAAELGVNHLVSMGYRRIAIVTGPLTLKNERRRLHGYKKALERAGIAVDDELIWRCNLRPEQVADVCAEQMRRVKPTPEAIFATNGQTGLGVLRGLRACGLKTPDDIAFVTFDELTVDDLFTPAITTVLQPAEEIGLRAAEILLERLEKPGKEERRINVRLPATLKIRDSSRLRRTHDMKSLSA